MVLDTNGDPIANARVMIDPALTSGVPVITHTDEDGIYFVQDLPIVPYYIYAWTTVTFGGQSFCLRLGMPNASHYDAFTPTSDRLDGSGAVSLTRTLVPGSGEPVLEDLPVADHTVSGVIRRGGEERALHIGVGPADGYDAQTSSAALVFEPGGNQCISLANGIEPMYLFVHSPYEAPY